MPDPVFQSSSEYGHLLRILLQNPVSLLCGSAISIFEPTSLQSGASVTCALAEALAREANVGESFASLISSSAFEVLLQTYPRQDVVGDIIESYFQYYGNTPSTGIAVRPNNIHNSIARLVIDRKVNNVITTNYDGGIEQAFSNFATTPPKTIVRKFDRGTNTGNIFKIHGSAEQHGTVIYSLLQEQTWPKWKSRRLKRIAGKRLLVTGYSGLDFEVCPELHSLELDLIVWVALPQKTDPTKPDLRPNAIKVLERSANSYVFCGDMRQLLTDLSGFDCTNSNIPSTTIQLSELLLGHLSTSERRLWAGRVFAELRAPKAIWNVVSMEAFNGPLSYDFRTLKCSALIHSGRYLDAADENAALSSDTTLPLNLRVSHKVGESGAASMGGFDLRAEVALREAALLATGFLDERERATTSNSIEWMRLILMKGLPDRANAKYVAALLSRLQSLYRSAIGNGEYWLAALCSNELKDISGEDARALPARKFERNATELFGQIGNFVGQVTAERDRVRRSMDPKDAAIIETRVPQLIEYGLLPELWRVLYTLIHFEKDQRAREFLFSRFNEVLTECQFEQSYVDQMVRAGQSAVALPKGVKLATSDFFRPST